MDIIAVIKKAGVEYVDKRPNKGSLWIIGGNELAPLVDECKSLGFKFAYKEGGGKATKGKNAWWVK